MSRTPRSASRRTSLAGNVLVTATRVTSAGSATARLAGGRDPGPDCAEPGRHLGGAVGRAGPVEGRQPGCVCRGGVIRYLRKSGMSRSSPSSVAGRRGGRAEVEEYWPADELGPKGRLRSVTTLRAGGRRTGRTGCFRAGAGATPASARRSRSRTACPMPPDRTAGRPPGPCRLGVADRSARSVRWSGGL